MATPPDEIQFESISGVKGDVKRVAHTCLRPFKANQAVFTDSCGGMGTALRGVFVAGKTVRPDGGDAPLPTFVFGPTARGAALAWQACPAGERIELDIEFRADCVWEGRLRGVALAEMPER